MFKRCLYRYFSSFLIKLNKENLCIPYALSLLMYNLYPIGISTKTYWGIIAKIRVFLYIGVSVIFPLFKIKLSMSNTSILFKTKQK